MFSYRSLQLGQNLSQSERPSKKYRFRHDVKERIKERHERKTAETCDLIHDNVQSKSMFNYLRTGQATRVHFICNPPC